MNWKGTWNKAMLFLLKAIIKYLLVPVGIVYTALFGSKDEIIILMYHRVNDSTNKELAVSKSDFKWHMDYLYRKGYKVISMDEAYSMILNGTLRGKYVVITFDDGYRDYYTNAYPVLKKYNFPSIMYLCPGHVEKPGRYWWDHDEEDTELLNWVDIHKLSREGLASFGSHTMDHADMDSPDPEELEGELTNSKDILERELGKSIRHFAYPRGIYSRIGEELLRRYYSTGVLISNGKKVDKDCSVYDAYILMRIPIMKSDGRYLFVARIKGWLAIEELMRRYYYNRRGMKEAVPWTLRIGR